MKNIWDISPPVDEQAAVFPGDTTYTQRLDVGPLVEIQHIAHALKDLCPRVLIQTNRRASQVWGSFTALAGENIDFLATKNVVFIGIDTPSTDPATSQTLASHQQLLRHQMRVLENLVLDDVPPSDYELIAPLLKLMEADASPVRTILRNL